MTAAHLESRACPSPSWIVCPSCAGELRRGTIVNRLRREDERPSKYVMAMYLRQRGWKRRQLPPTMHEPVYWRDPMGLLGECPRTEEAYDLQVRRDANGVGSKP